MSEPVVSLEKFERIAVLTLQRPKALNTLDRELTRQLRTTLEAVEADREVRALVLTGAGANFCGGADLRALHALGADVADHLYELVGDFHAFILALCRSEKIVVAAVEGACAGGGLSIALAADLAVAGRGARFATAYRKLGLSPDGGQSFFLTQLAGTRRASELLLIGETFDAEAAHELGLVNALVDDGRALDEARRWAATAAANAPASNLAKRWLNGAYGAALEDRLKAEREGLVAAARSPNFSEGLAAFLQKRAPNFR